MNNNPLPCYTLPGIGSRHRFTSMPHDAWTMKNLMLWALTSLAVIAASYLIAAMSFRFIEKPFPEGVHKRIHS